jgi:hypothetical protein
MTTVQWHFTPHRKKRRPVISGGDDPWACTRKTVSAQDFCPFLDCWVVSRWKVLLPEGDYTIVDDIAVVT